MSSVKFCPPLLLVVLLVPWHAARGQSGPAVRALDLRGCIERALQQHPLLAATRARVDGAEQFRAYAGTRPNPSITLQGENWRFTGDPPFSPRHELDLFIFGTHTWERGGKAERRRAVAAGEVAMAEAEMELARRRVQLDVLRSYYRALNAQAVLDLHRENRQNLDQLVLYNATRVREGDLAEGELVRVRLEQQTLAANEAAAAQELERAKLDLLRAMGESRLETDFRLADQPDLTARQVRDAAESAPPLDRLLDDALARRPELRLARARLDHARAALRLAEARARPDWALSFGYKRASGYNTMIAGVTIPLPLFDKNQGEIGRAAAEVAALDRELAAEENDVRAEVQAAWRAAASLRQRLAALQNNFLLEADDARDIALAAYREGAADLYRVLESQRARNEARLLYARTQFELRLSLAELELSAGQELVASK